MAVADSCGGVRRINWKNAEFDEIKELCSGKVEHEISIQFSTDHTENRLVTTDKEIEDWINKIR